MLLAEQHTTIKNLLSEAPWRDRARAGKARGCGVGRQIAGIQVPPGRDWVQIEPRPPFPPSQAWGRSAETAEEAGRPGFGLSLRPSYCGDRCRRARKQPEDRTS